MYFSRNYLELVTRSRKKLHLNIVSKGEGGVRKTAQSSLWKTDFCSIIVFNHWVLYIPAAIYVLIKSNTC